jgi:hypothetical protein
VKHVHERTLPHGFITMTRLCSEARANLVPSPATSGPWPSSGPHGGC